MKILNFLLKQNKTLVISISCVLIIGIGIVDNLTGEQFAFSVFYLLMISVITWVTDGPSGYMASFFGALVWWAADVFGESETAVTLVPFWNALIRFAFFTIVTFLLASIKYLLEQLKNLSETDPLTSAANPRHFYQVLEMEVNRFHRYRRPFSVAFMDLDNFKQVNDQNGHRAGDLLLQSIVTCIRAQVRKTDVIARLGGDEFALLFPETDELAVQQTVEKIHKTLIGEMNEKHWPVTFSIGVVTFKSIPDPIEKIIDMSDALMYSIKSDGKGSVKYMVYEGGPASN